MTHPFAFHLGLAAAMMDEISFEEKCMNKFHGPGSMGQCPLSRTGSTQSGLANTGMTSLQVGEKIICQIVFLPILNFGMVGPAGEIHMDTAKGYVAPDSYLVSIYRLWWLVRLGD
jgi:hypothetical protein